VIETVDGFYARVRAAAVAALEHGAATIDAIVTFTSVLPTEMKLVLDQMEADGVVVKIDDRYRLVEERQPTCSAIHSTWDERRTAGRATLDNFRLRLHLPHCLDYEWWFATTGIEAVIESVVFERHHVSPAAAACVGAPFVAVYLAAAVPELRVIALDRSAPTVAAMTGCALDNLDARTYDVRQPLPHDLVGTVQVVFCDPPWYVDYYRAFLIRCTELLNADGVLGAILFPPLTRPNAQFERNQILHMFPELGLHLEALQPLAVLYDTPPFEATLLAVQQSAWRSGDLIVARQWGTRPTPSGTLLVEDADWETILVGKVKVMLRVKPDEDVATMPLIRALPNGPAIGSVSRRDEKRNLIDLWTSTHVGYAASGWRLLRVILDGIAADATMESIIHAAEQLVERELRHDERDAIAVACRELEPVLLDAPYAATSSRDRHAALPSLDPARE
jgi:hypothetical protein